MSQFIPPDFHPAVNGWFSDTFDQPTTIQRQAWSAIAAGHHPLIAAPTGSGKTLAAFLAELDRLTRLALADRLPDKTLVVYVSPLKALSNDIHRNLQEPLAGIRRNIQKQCGRSLDIRVMVRTGDTPAWERAAMVRQPPHILVTTPESLYLLLTSVGGREMLRSTDTVILDEIHALVENKRGMHLSLSVERLRQLTGKHLTRIGLSATQRPIKQVAAFLCGDESADCTILDAGHTRRMDVALELPGSPLTAVMPHEVWGEVYDRLETLIREHHTTLLFVNTRAMAERLAHHLIARLGESWVSTHHGSMSREKRHTAEQQLKAGTLRALVSTASLELGIDIGSVDLVCQLGSPKRIATLLQRVGRSGHRPGEQPKGRLFPLTRDDLVECTALLAAVRHEELDHIVMPRAPLDVLAQQIVAEVASQDYTEDELFGLFTRAWPYRSLSRQVFDQVVDMLDEGYTPKRGRSRAYLHRDVASGSLRARKGARLQALMSGGVIPDQFDYEVIQDPAGTFVGTLNEDFAIESTAGDIVQLGANAWRILRTQGGKIHVEDAHGQPPTMPFWFGEAPARSKELSLAVATLREEIDSRLTKPGAENPGWNAVAIDWLISTIGISHAAALQITDYLGATREALGVIPSQNNIVMERFFNEAGDMHLIIHAPFGSRLNRAWGLALRKRFCRQFNFELQAAANEDAVILSLGATHSFPLDEVFRYLKPATVRHVLTQAVLDAPMFGTRWRWNATTALALQRRRTGGRVPPPIQRARADDLVAQVFPDQLACLENIAGERQIPDHPLVNQTLHDCLHEAMDVEGLEEVLGRLMNGQINCHARELREPSPLAQEIINARPYAFLDDAPLEERRTHAIRNRRWLDPAEAAELGRLDKAAIDLVREEAWPDAQTLEELHDALILCAYLTAAECLDAGWLNWCNELAATGRALRLNHNNTELWLAIERLPLFEAVYREPELTPNITLSDEVRERLNRRPSPADTHAALAELLRGRLEGLGPVTARRLASETGLAEKDINRSLQLLEQEGFAFQGRYTPDHTETEWCERRLLARIHKYTIQRLRREIEPVAPATFMRFVFEWQHLTPDTMMEGPEAVRAILEQMEGVEAPGAIWEGDILPARIKNYDYTWLDALCISGQTTWAQLRTRPRTGQGTGPIRTTPVSIVFRASLPVWTSLSQANTPAEPELSTTARTIHAILEDQGALFFSDLAHRATILRTQTEDAIAELVSAGKVTSDSFMGLRALLVPAKYRQANTHGRRRLPLFDIDLAGRWSLIPRPKFEADDETRTEAFARILLKRFGIVFRKLVEREPFSPPWRDLVRVYRRLEARGELRGGRFVTLAWGEQYALPEAIAALRAVARREPVDEFVSISAADPANLLGVVLPGRKVPATTANRILFRNGEPVLVREGGQVAYLKQPDKEEQWMMETRLIRRNVPANLKAYLG